MKESDVLIVGQHDHIYIYIYIYIDHHQMTLTLPPSCKRSSDDDGIRQQPIRKAYEYNNMLIVAGDFNYKSIEWDNQ